MVSRQSILVVVSVAILVFMLSACQAASTSPTQMPTAQPTPTFALATPYAQQPAAGICASFDGNTVTITLNVDVPSPRCAIVRADQTLTVVNATLSTIQVSIGNFSSSVLPGAQYAIDVPFGDYLAVGVHQLSASPAFGPELWLKGK